MVVVRNDDRPGVIGRVGTILGESLVNITDMNVGRSSDDVGALMVIATGQPVAPEVAQRLVDADGVTECSVIDLSGFVA